MSLKQLRKFIKSENIAIGMDEEKLNKIGRMVVDGAEKDDTERDEWLQQTKEAIELAKLTKKTKSTPWPNAANVKYPLLTTTAIQFASRAYPEIVKGNRVVRCAIIGKDDNEEKQKRADRVSKHMSWQLLYQSKTWEEGMDKLLHMLPVVGCLFKKTYWSKTDDENKSELCLPDEVIVSQSAESTETARRITHILKFVKNDIEEKQRAGTWVSGEIKLQGNTDDTDDSDEGATLHEFYEQHRWLDLDEDGYEEPYIVTVHKDSTQVVRIFARYGTDDIKLNASGRLMKIEARSHFTKFGFLPSFDGSFYDIGFGQLLAPINETINTVVNQLLDAGRAKIMGGGLVSSYGGMSGDMTLEPGVYKNVKISPELLQSAFKDAPWPEPSPTLFQLLGFMVDAGKEVASLHGIMADLPTLSQVPMGTMLAMMEEGKKVFNAIYKRIYRSLKKEFGKLAKLNAEFLEDNYYFRVLDGPQQEVAREDYDLSDFDIIPVAEPSMSSDIQRMQKVQLLMEMRGTPGVEDYEINCRYLEALEVPEPEKILPPPDKQKPPGPDPALLLEMQKLELDKEKIDTDRMKSESALFKMKFDIQKIKSEVIKNLALAEAAEAGQQLGMYKAEAENMLKIFEIQTGGNENGNNKPDGGGGGGAQPIPAIPEVPQNIAGPPASGA